MAAGPPMLFRPPNHHRGCPIHAAAFAAWVGPAHTPPDAADIDPANVYGIGLSTGAMLIPKEFSDSL